MNILVISGSPRKNGNTEIMANVFSEAAEKNGNTVSRVNLSGTKVGFCTDCEYCLTHQGVCVKKDGMDEIYEKMEKAELLVFASPIYYFGMSAQMAAVFDRLYAHLNIGYHPTGCMLLLDSGDPHVYAGAIAQYKGTADFIGWKDQGIVTVAGMKEKGDMKNSPDLEKVRELARSIH
ncbi:MAG TPA: flavodoxin family protein [Ruminococcaceae bacterium]|nr:flavodoxin family protein [Oscillospiraceae bacterium]